MVEKPWQINIPFRVALTTVIQYCNKKSEWHISTNSSAYYQSIKADAWALQGLIEALPPRGPRSMYMARFKIINMDADCRCECPRQMPEHLIMQCKFKRLPVSVSTWTPRR